MEVQLYVYDLSKGLARQMSGSLLGVQIDAVYHTAVVFGGIEYFFGAGVQTTYPGATHYGKPMEIVPLGQTDLPMEIILEYLDSLKQTYTKESYDLFLHNCNNFSNDFVQFLVGKNIPSHITSLPQTVLNTPFGQMLKPQLDQAMRGITQAPVAQAAIPKPTAGTNSPYMPGAGSAPVNGNGSNTVKGYNMSDGFPTGEVHKVTSLKKLDMLLESAKQSCAVIFFTSATCPPCKLVYPAYDELAAEAGKKAVLIKVDLSEAYEIGAKYRVRATPTFMSFLKGEKENEWVGASEGQLKGNVRMLVQMAFPPHPHASLRLRVFQRRHKPVIYTKVPPIEKLVAKMGPKGSDPAAMSLKDFICRREASGAIEATIPSIPSIEAFVTNSVETLPSESLFPVVDLVRCALIDQRMSACLATAGSHRTITSIFTFVESLGDKCPYSLRIVTLQLACNLFTSSIFATQLIQQAVLLSHLLQLVTASLLDTVHSAVRVAAASLAFNMAAFNHLRRLDGEQDLLPEAAQVELMASLLEAVSRENESKDGLRGLFTAIGLLAYCAPKEGELAELCDALGAKVTVKDKESLSEDLQNLKEEVTQILP